MGAVEAKSWPFEQARLLVKRLGLQKGSPYPDRHIVFQTGFGASGYPHIGTFAEVVRTNMVCNAFERLAVEVTGNSRAPRTTLVVFADDYDAMRRVPDSLPEAMQDDIGLPLTSVRDPVGEYESFGDRNVDSLRQFCADYLGATPTIVSATEMYRSGRFNDGLRDACRLYDEIMEIMLPTLGSERQATYSPIMPISPTTGRVLQVPVEIVDAASGMIRFTDEDGTVIETDVFNGAAKLQWKVDWAMRWRQLGIDYEMYGKDLIDSFSASKKIVRLFGSEPPAGMVYELFVDEEGKKISKSLGNGISIEQWMEYGTPEALSMFMFQSPKSSKSLHLGVIPKVTDEYLKARIDYPRLVLGGEGKQNHLDSPAWHIHGGHVPPYHSDVNYALLVNLASVSNATDPDVLRDYLSTYRQIPPNDRVEIERLIPKAIAYFQTRVLPEKLERQRDPTSTERDAVADLSARLQGMADNLDGEAYQFEVYEWGKAWVITAPDTFPTLRDTFRMLYEVFFGAESGPRFGTFVAAYGRERTIALLRATT